MSYKVVYSPSVLANIREHVRYLIEDQKVSALTVERWYRPLFERVEGLYDMPRLYGIDHGASKRLGFEVHKLTYKKYLIHYTIDDDCKVVELIAFMHGARRREA